MNSTTSNLEKLPCAFYTLSDGSQLRYAVLEPKDPPRATCLVAQGRREFLEKKYLELGREFLTRGYRVILFDWRGQGLSPRFLKDDQRERDHLADLNVHVNDFNSFYRDIVRSRCSGSLLIFAHSMGALIVTHWLAENLQQAVDVRAIIMTAPAFAVNVPIFCLPLSRLAMRLGRSDHYALGQHDYNQVDRRFAGNFLSHDPERFKVIERYFDAYPDMKVGGVTWNWLVTALTAMKQLRQPGYLERIAKPVLALIGAQDYVTPPTKVIPLARRLPQAEIVTIRGAWHDIMNEADQYRDQAWQHIEPFLKRFMSV